MAKISITPHPTIAHLLAILILMLAAGGSFCASAYTMPADKLVLLSNKELCDKAWSHWQASQLDSALICYSIVADRTDNRQSRDDLRKVVMANENIGKIYLSRYYDFGRAMQYFLRAENIAKKHQFNKLLADIYYGMAVVENYKNDVYNDFAFNPKAFELFQKSFTMAVEQNVPNTQVEAIISLIISAARNDKLELITKETNIFLSQDINDTIQARDFARYLCLTSIHLTEGNDKEALKELSKLETSLNVDKVIIPQYLSIAYQCKFYFYREMGDEKSALQQLNAMEHFGQEHDIKECVIEALFHKHHFYQEKGNTALANEYEVKYLKAKDKFLLDAKLAKADEEKVLFKLNEANHEIKELSYKQRIQHTELIAVAVVAVLLLALLVLAWVNYRRTKQKNETLYQHNMQLMANEDRLRQLHQAEEEATSAPTVKYRRSNMEGDDIAQVMEKVDRVMESSTEIFTADFSLDRLAELTGETRLRLSQAINKVPGRTFYSILNGYRVREACRRMDDKVKYSGLTIEAIGQSVGFKNRSSFVAIFKRITGVTPSAYFKQSTEPNSPASEPQAD
jgi:YesN/AraC family two-component response regulator